MKRLPKTRWRKAWHLTRQMDRFEMDNDHARLKLHPDMAKAVDYALGASDSLSRKSPGIYLGMMNRKRNTIARGLPWLGFRFHERRVAAYNCRCVGIPVTASYVYGDEPNEPQ